MCLSRLNGVNFFEYIDAVEGANATHVGKRSNHEKRPDFDEKARAYANKLSLPMTGGSDVHSVNMIGGGIRTKRKLKDIHDFTKLIMSGKDYVIYDSDNAYKPM